MNANEIIEAINVEVQDKEILRVKHLYGTVWLMLDQLKRDKSDHEIGSTEIWFSGNWRLMTIKEKVVVSSDDEEFSAEQVDAKLDGLVGTKIESVDMDDENEKLIIRFENNYTLEVGIVDSDLFTCSVYDFEDSPKLNRTMGYDLEAEEGWYLKDAEDQSL